MRAMTQGLATTFRVLEKADDRTAVPLLLSALDSPHATVRDNALAAILVRHTPAGHREILRRLSSLSDRWKAILREHSSRITRTLREALSSDDSAMCGTACRAVVWFHEYDLVPTLLNVLEDHRNPNADLAAQTLQEMAKQLYEQLEGSRDKEDRHGPQAIRRSVVNCLEQSVNRWSRHRRREVIETFLLLADRDNATLKQVLQNPRHTAFPAIIDVLSKNEQDGVLQLLLSFFEDPGVPSAALTVAANRGDLKFLSQLSWTITTKPSVVRAHNLKRIRSIGWLRSADSIVDGLDDAGQEGIVRLLMNSSVPRTQTYAVIEHVLLHGKPGGRREAARALAEFNGAEANALALRAMDDPDPQVQANVLVQLRRRGIPGIWPRIVKMVDSRHSVVRNAACEALAEFTFKRFMAAFDMLEDNARRSTGMLIKKIDPQTRPLLLEGLKSQVRSRRMRALTIARVIDVVEPLEETIIELLHTGDHLVRIEAVAALARCPTPSSRRALETAVHDRAEMVQEAAKKALRVQAALTQAKGPHTR
jgi:HEAT repeat protein